jgi:predicted site-specific integrase-resolvase
MRSKFPTAEIIKDYGSGINFKRKGLQTLLERVMLGDKLRIIVAHRDRLARFGGEIIQFLVEQNGGEVVVLD